MTARSTPQTVTSARHPSSTWRSKARSPRSLRSSRPIRSRRTPVVDSAPPEAEATDPVGVGSLTAFKGKRGRLPRTGRGVGHGAR